MSNIKKIRARCLECVDGQAEVRACAFFACPLWPYRMSGDPYSPVRNPNLRPRQRAGSGEELATLEAWAWHNYPPGAVRAPDPLEMTLPELAALIPRRLTPGQALSRDDWDSAHGVGARKRRLAEERGAVENGRSAGT